MKKGSSSSITDDIRARIRADVDVLKRTHSDRKSLSIATAGLLLDKYGVIPSCAMVREFTQSGSMTSINNDLKEFFARIQEKLSLSIDAPSIPDELKKSFSSMAAEFWNVATQAALAEFESERTQCEASVLQAQQRVHEVGVENARLLSEVQDMKARVEQHNEAKELAERSLASARSEFEAKKAHFEEKTDSLSHQLRESEKSRKEAEERFLAELEEERSQRERSKEYLEGQNRHAMMQIEEARQQSVALKEDLRQARTDAALKDNLLRQQINALQDRLSSAQSLSAELEAKASAISEERDRLLKQNDVLASANSRLNDSLDKMVVQLADVRSSSQGS